MGIDKEGECGVLGSLITTLMLEFQNSRWRIQYGHHPESNFKFFDYFASNFVNGAGSLFANHDPDKINATQISNSTLAIAD
ncbi:hypothetical protein NQ318_003192 [Aromia moschata]|uniref:Uncharacterized protein n=1 Tax=Aromia moschata TaxID=1265417 RepID=A0AAV8YEQ9_9CUCU|nr:hypothetical protein NQ318_003192 [Aromia moschata]